MLKSYGSLKIIIENSKEVHKCHFLVESLLEADLFWPNALFTKSAFETDGLKLLILSTQRVGIKKNLGIGLSDYKGHLPISLVPGLWKWQLHI